MRARSLILMVLVVALLPLRVLAQDASQFRHVVVPGTSTYEDENAENAATVMMSWQLDPYLRTLEPKMAYQVKGEKGITDPRFLDWRGIPRTGILMVNYEPFKLPDNGTAATRIRDREIPDGEIERVVTTLENLEEYGAKERFVWGPHISPRTGQPWTDADLFWFLVTYQDAWVECGKLVMPIYVRQNNSTTDEYTTNVDEQIAIGANVASYLGVELWVSMRPSSAADWTPMTADQVTAALNAADKWDADGILWWAPANGEWAARNSSSAFRAIAPAVEAWRSQKANDQGEE